MATLRTVVAALLVTGVMLVSPAVLVHGYAAGVRAPHVGGTAENLGMGGNPASVPQVREKLRQIGVAPSLPNSLPSGTGSGNPTPWVSGVEYSGPSSLASRVAVTMSLPDDLPSSSDRYYVAISTFDGAESYDQLGFANDNGSWQVYYGSSTACGTQPDTHWNAFSLDRNATYTFEISVEGGGVILFQALQGPGPAIWTETAHTGATYLQLEPTQTCGTSIDPGYTETEEVEASSLVNPPYNFVLANASENGLPETEWLDLVGSSNSTAVLHNASNVTLLNAPFDLRFAATLDTVTIETAGAPQQLHATVSVQMENPGGTVGLSASTSAPGWSFTASPPSDNASFSSVVSVDLPGGIAVGTYVVEIEASNSAGLSNRVALVITALAGLGLNATSTPASGELDANETVSLALNATGGRPAYTYSWPGLPKGCESASDGAAVCRLSAPATYSLLAGVGDTLGYAFYLSVTLVAVPDPSLSASSATALVSTGGTLSLDATLTGGIAPFTIAWQGLPPGCAPGNATALRCLPTAAGQYAVTLSATDHTGFRSSLSFSVTVATPSTGETLSLGAVGLVLIGGGLVILIATCVATLVRRHR